MQKGSEEPLLYQLLNYLVLFILAFVPDFSRFFGGSSGSVG
jgi:hypothetical protein